MLDLLKDRPRTTGELDEVVTMSRFGVMKHLYRHLVGALRDRFRWSLTWDQGKGMARHV